MIEANGDFRVVLWLNRQLATQHSPLADQTPCSAGPRTSTWCVATHTIALDSSAGIAFPNVAWGMVFLEVGEHDTLPHVGQSFSEFWLD